jgi:ferric-dicitrate binding protein FerR (iron transport regulator)
VVLQEGKVQLTATNQPAVVMKPGDMATVKWQSPRIQLKKVQPQQYDAWKESYIMLDGKSLAEIITTLEDTFGVTIKLEERRLLDKKLTGKLQTKVAQDCIDNLAVILEASVQQTGNTYLFR